MNLTSAIIASQEWENIDHMNPHLELSAKVYMAWDYISDADKDGLQELWRKEYRDRTEIKRGLFKRFPPDIATDYQAGYSTSHDELITGICFASYLFDEGKTAARILDEGRTLGFYFSGHSPFKPVHGKWYAPIINFLDKFIDSEWLIFFNPIYRGYAKLAAGSRITSIEESAIKLDLLLTKTANLIDLRILFLEHLGLFGEHTKRARQRIGNSYRGRYGNNPIYLELFKLRDKVDLNS